MFFQDDWSKQRVRMVRDIEAHAGETSDYTGVAKFHPRVIRAMGEVERHLFVPASMRRSSYGDHPISIGSGQTISQPFIVALMADLLSLKEEDTVLEAGAGCGYHSAILSKLCRRVFAVEIIKELAEMATKNLEGYDNVEVACRNGSFGWPEKAPFDAISVAAASPTIPADLVRQLKPGGRMVIPLGLPGSPQELTLVEKTGGESYRQKQVLSVIFVPFVSS